MRLCLVEDELIMGESLTQRFSLEGISCDWFRDAGSALAAFEKTDYAALVSDVRLPDQSGEEMFHLLLAHEKSPPPTLFITGFGTIDQAVRLLKHGSLDYISKPFDLDELLDKLRAICPELFADQEKACREAVLGVSKVMRGIQETLARVAGHSATVLITGDSGVGKEYAARYLHQNGEGEDRPFIAINCAAIPENLLEAELFGYAKGAFTGAERKHRGVFERAHGGTLFLDEVGDMSMAMQAKLLRAVQDGSVQPVGSEKTIQVKVRLICATNRDLKQEVSNGNFREDLYYRINVIHVPIPPLTLRKEDILWFAHSFVEEYSHEHGVRYYLSSMTERCLAEQPWPGNVRELRHTIERACILTEQGMIGPEDVGASAFTGDEPCNPHRRELKTEIQECEKRLIHEALELHQGRIVETADSLGISRKNLWEKMRKHKIS